MKTEQSAVDWQKSTLTHPGITIDAEDEFFHEGPLAIRQNWKHYTTDDHQLWSFLFAKQCENLADIAYIPWLEAMTKIGLKTSAIPKLAEIGRITDELTGWLPVPVSGFLDPYDYFHYLSKRQFPTVVQLRDKDNWEFLVDPDLFHDAFGHLPMHSHPVFADFLQLFGEVALQAKTAEQLRAMERIYWFTVEYGLIREAGQVKVCGSGHLSGFKEARHSLTDAVVKRPFVLDDVIAQDYNPHILQPVLFVMDSYEQLYEAMRIKAREFGV